MAIPSTTSDHGALAELLRSRSLRLTACKQQAIHHSRHLPPAVRKAILKTLWPPPLRHMRYVPAEVALHPADGGVWKLGLREGSKSTFVSRPLSGLAGFTDRPAIVIATGPTANEFDWSSLADGRRLIWAVNGAPTLLAKHGLNCDFLVITDHRFARDGADHITLAADQGATLLFSYEAAAGFAAA